MLDCIGLDTSRPPTLEEGSGGPSPESSGLAGVGGVPQTIDLPGGRVGKVRTVFLPTNYWRLQRDSIA